MRLRGIVLSCLVLLVTTPAMAQVDVAPYVKNDRFGTIKISPNGDYYAATVPLPDVDKTTLAILRRSDNKLTATFQLGKNTHVQDFWWVNPERLLISIAEKFGSLDSPALTGELYAINADGTGADLLVGQRVAGAGLNTRIQPKKVEKIAAFLIDDLPADDKNVLIAVSPFDADAYTRVEKMDVYSGRRIPVVRVPVRRARFVTDNNGVVRFAIGADTDNSVKLYYRAGDGSDWKLVNDEAASSRIETALGFSADNRIAYLQVEQPKGPDAIVAMDVASGTRKDVLRDDDTDPYSIVYQPGTGVPVGARFMDGKPRTEFFDKANPTARVYRSLEAAFAGEAPVITSSSADGKLTLVQTYSDRNPGDFYVFDTIAKKADHLIARRAWFDPEKMASTRPIAFDARDGMRINGYLTLPPGSDGKRLPMVVNPHGGPFGVSDAWGFGSEQQLLAAAGYAVLQVNFRGSTGYGRAFSHAGAREWGGKMQDDLTDATHWAIQQGIADGGRICIYGASYGAYASLMGVAKEPALYKCAIGYIGVYDLPTMFTHGDIPESGSGETFLREWLGERSTLAGISPNRIADRIKVPVFLAAGGEDERAPIEHSKMMERALIKAGVPVETLYYDTEGHGFYQEKHRREYYTRLLSFLARHIGGRPPTATASTTR